MLPESWQPAPLNSPMAYPARAPPVARSSRFVYSLLRDAAVLCIEQTCTRPKSQQGLALGQLLVEDVASVAVQECEGLQLRQGGQCLADVVPLCRGAVLESDGGCVLVRLAG
jgi:hypothetical protein